LTGIGPPAGKKLSLVSVLPIFCYNGVASIDGVAPERVSPMLKVNIRDVDNIKVIDLSGKITMGTGSEIFRTVVDDLLVEGEKHILFNFSGIDFIDSAGLGEIVASFRTVKGLRGDMKIFNVGKNVYSTLSISKLLPILEIFDTEDEAIRSFKKRSKKAAPKASPSGKRKPRKPSLPA
jgi:anti-sigma B factor antagonist